MNNKNAIILVLLFKEISLLPELSSPAHFRVQGVWEGMEMFFTDTSVSAPMQECTLSD